MGGVVFEDCKKEKKEIFVKWEIVWDSIDGWYMLFIFLCRSIISYFLKRGFDL